MSDKAAFIVGALVVGVPVVLSLIVLGAAVWLSKRAERDELEDQAAVPLFIDPSIIMTAQDADDAVPGVGEDAANSGANNIEPEVKESAPADEPEVSEERLLEAGGWTRFTNYTVHTRCLWARRDGRKPCDRCRPLLVGPATDLPPPPSPPASPVRCSTCDRPMRPGSIHHCKAVAP